MEVFRVDLLEGYVLGAGLASWQLRVSQKETSNPIQF